MERIEGSARVSAHCRGGVVAIGNFDGVHRGHQELLRLAGEKARESGAPLGVVTFEPHPRTFFIPAEPIFRITSAEIKARALAACGVDFLASLAFDRELASREAEEFVQGELVERLAVSHVVTGYDFHFGRSRKGSPDTMRALGAELGFGVTVVEQVTDDSGVAPFASSVVRNALRRGHVRAAAEMLGYWWTVHATVVPGDKRGRTMGFPTVNVTLEEGCEPGEGIYAVRVREADGEDRQAWRGAGYVGKRPTFGKTDVVLEVFLLGFSGDLYGRRLMIEFIDFIRPDMAFPDAQALGAQMEQDCREIEKRLEAVERDDPMTRFPIGRLQADGRL